MCRAGPPRRRGRARARARSTTATSPRAESLTYASRPARRRRSAARRTRGARRDLERQPVEQADGAWAVCATTAVPSPQLSMLRGPGRVGSSEASTARSSVDDDDTRLEVGGDERRGPAARAGERSAGAAASPSAASRNARRSTVGDTRSAGREVPRANRPSCGRSGAVRARRDPAETGSRAQVARARGLGEPRDGGGGRPRPSASARWGARGPARRPARPRTPGRSTSGGTRSPSSVASWPSARAGVEELERRRAERRRT